MSLFYCILYKGKTEFDTCKNTVTQRQFKINLKQKGIYILLSEINHMILKK